MIAILCVTLFGCDKNTFKYVKSNMSELTTVYFFGENDNFSCSLFSGERESEYLLNGVSEKSVPFALLSLQLKENAESSIVKISLTVDGQASERELEINTLSGAYMVDLEMQLSGTETISINYDDSQVELECLSNNFGIDSGKALEIASRELEDKIVLKKTWTKLNAECYLRILDKNANDYDGTFWCFTVLNVDNENYSVVISTNDGSVLAKSK